MSRAKKRLLLSAIALLSMAGFAGFTNAELNLLFKAYGLLFTCQVGFLLFFLARMLPGGSSSSPIDKFNS
jgi:hypothetical protein